MRNIKAMLQYLTAVSIFGTTGLILRWTVIPSEIMVVCRGIIGALLILAYLLLTGKRPSWKAIQANLKWLCFGGIALGVNWIFLFGAYRYTSVAIASLCNYTAPIIVIFLSPMLFNERLTKKQILCIAASVTGFILISGILSDNSSLDFRGILLGMGAAAGFVGIVVANKRLKSISPFDRVVVQLLISACTVLPYVLMQNWGKAISWNVASLIWMLVLAIVHTAFAYYFYYNSMGELPVQTIALLGYVEPVVSVLCSTMILQEPLGLLGGVGAVLIIGAAIISEVH